MYKRKYLKYKKKYFASIAMQGGFVPDEETSDEDVVDEIKTIRGILNDEYDEVVEDTVLKEQKYVGDSNITTDKINKIVPIGKIHGKICDYDMFNEEDFVDKLPPNRNKILNISTKDIFDQFTDKYGFIQKKTLKIDWLAVESHFRGIYVNESVDNRVEDATYLNKVMTSWVVFEYKYINDVVIFVKEENIKYERQITWPFKGYITDYYGLDENIFVTINEDVIHDKVLVIDSIKHFDQFTNKYGDNEKIMWDKVRDGYIGIYLGDNEDLINNRKEKCFFNGKLVNSWWGSGKLENGLVYMFI
jgi:hypothetical protein